KGGIYLTGYTASDSITLSGKTHLNNGYGDFFIVKYSSRGQMEWVKFAKCNYYDIVEGIITDKTGNVYATGAFRGDSILFDSIKLLHSKSDYGYSNIFIVKYNSKGKVIWAKSGDNNDYDNDASTGITIDNSGNIAVTGYFKGSSIKFDAVTLTRKKNGIDIFIAKYDSNGILQWAKDIGDSLQIANTNCITSDTVGNIFIAGSFTSPKMYLDSIYLINSSYGQKDIFIAQLNLNGKVIWAKSAGGSYNDDRAWSISKGTSNSIYIGGDIWSSVVYFDKDSVITKSKWNDMFLAKLSYSNSTSIFNPPPPHQTHSATLYPNPARQTITINTKQSIQKTEVFNLAGVLVTTANNTNTLNVEALPKGMYFVKIYTTQGVQNIKFVRE
ncbi:MAG: T9SS type A sorting domain-containing protein, partial [Bacteroidetes bacterium]|nr:T9SS type A sorting domain-containing protein [Bacteroidota bacterium]